MSAAATTDQADFIGLNLSAFDDFIFFQKFKLRVCKRNPVTHFHNNMFSLVNNFFIILPPGVLLCTHDPFGQPQQWQQPLQER